MSSILQVLADNPAWFLNDMLVVKLFIATIFFVIKKEEHPIVILLEAVAFIFLYSVIFDNLAINYMKYYTYGRSIFMFGGVITSMPLTEWMIVYFGLRMLEKAKVPVWIQPIMIGLFGFLQDLSLDPVAIRQMTGDLGRWTWNMGANWSQYLGIPIYNFHGWFLMPMCAAIAFMIGRHFYKRSGFKKAVGYSYPIIGAIAALGLLFSPLSAIFIDATYPSAIGSMAEWYTLAFWIMVGFAGIVIWRFRMKRPLDFHDDWPIIVIPAVLHLADLIGACVLGVPIVTVNAVIATVVHLAILSGAFFASRKMIASSRRSVNSSAL